MSDEIFANNAATTLGSAASSGTTTITVATGTGALFPTLTGNEYFTATLWAAGSTTGTPNEIVKVTARSGDTMTVVRGQEGTTPTAWSIGDTFANYPTADFYNRSADEGSLQAQAGNYADDTGTANAGVAALDPVPATLAAILGAPVRILKMTGANTGAYTLNLNGFGIKNVTFGGVALVAGQLPASQIFEVFWDGTNFELLSAPAKLPNVNLSNMPANTFKANLTGSAAAPADKNITDVLAALGFGGQSLTGNGYFILPNGLIIQWCTGISSGSSIENLTISFPIAFPNANLATVGNVTGSAIGTYTSNVKLPLNTTSAIFTTQSSGTPSGGISVQCIAIGY